MSPRLLFLLSSRHRLTRERDRIDAELAAARLRPRAGIATSWLLRAGVWARPRLRREVEAKPLPAGACLVTRPGEVPSPG